MSKQYYKGMTEIELLDTLLQRDMELGVLSTKYSALRAVHAQLVGVCGDAWRGLADAEQDSAMQRDEAGIS